MVRRIRYQAGLSFLEVIIASLILAGALFGINIAMTVSAQQSLKALKVVKLMIVLDAHNERRTFLKNSSFKPKAPLEGRTGWSDANYLDAHQRARLFGGGVYGNNLEFTASYELNRWGMTSETGEEAQNSWKVTLNDNPQKTSIFYLWDKKGEANPFLGDENDWLNLWAIPITNSDEVY